MFSRLLNARLRAAEKALKGGRLDEAFRLATAPDLREQKSCQAVLKDLSERLIERAREHFAEERFAEALADLDKAEAGGVQRDRIAELRQNIRIVANEVNRQQHSRRRRLDEARQRMEAGSLKAGRDLLAGAGEHDLEAKALEADIVERERQAVEGFAQIEKMIKGRQIVAALERFRKVKRLSPHVPEALAIESTLCSAVVGNARSALEAGRINRAAEELAALGDLGRSSPARRDVEDLIGVAQSASQALDRGDFESARRHVMRLQGLGFNPGWVKQSVKQLQDVDELVTSLHGGPLGENAKRRPPVKAAPAIARTPSLDETVVLTDRTPGAETLPSRLLVLVDGGGSYLLVRKDRITIGRAMSQNPADVPIRSDLAERHAEIARAEDDYFLFSPRDVEIDGRSTRHHLLRHGNRVTLARNARFTFRMPHRQSPSGVLEMSSSTHMPNDVRRVVLFRQTAMMGFGKNVHIMCNTAVHDLILFERSGRLWVRPQRNGRIDTEATPVELGTQTELFNISFIVEPWTVPTFGPSFG